MVGTERWLCNKYATLQVTGSPCVCDISKNISLQSSELHINIKFSYWHVFKRGKLVFDIYTVNSWNGSSKVLLCCQINQIFSIKCHVGHAVTQLLSVFFFIFHFTSESLVALWFSCEVEFLLFNVCLRNLHMVFTKSKEVTSQQVPLFPNKL